MTETTHTSTDGADLACPACTYLAIDEDDLAEHNQLNHQEA